MKNRQITKITKCAVDNKMTNRKNWYAKKKLLFTVNIFVLV